MNYDEAEREARLAAAIDADGTVSAAEQLAAVRRLLRSGVALTVPARDMVADLTRRLRPRDEREVT